MSTKETVAILGGTGDLGTGLAIRWSKAGYKIVIGSRTQEKADDAVAALKEISPDTPAEAMENGAAAAARRTYRVRRVSRWQQQRLPRQGD